MSKKKLLAVLTGMVMAFMGLAGVGAASADTTNTPVRNQPAKASLTVHKYLGATDSTLKPDGTKIDASKLTAKKALAGINFNLYKVKGVDISTNEGLKLATKLAEKPNITAKVIEDGKISLGGKDYAIDKAHKLTQTTNGDGEAVFKDTPRGLYIVEEDLAGSTDANIKTSDGAVVKDKITPIAPFAVTLPMTDPEGKAWNTDVHVYPKNQVNELTKTVVDMGVTTEKPESTTGMNEFTYVLSTTSTGADTNGDKVMDAADLGNLYQIVDQLPANVEYVKTTAKINDQTTTDFDATTVKDGNPERTTVTVAFKGAGLNTIAAGAKVEVTLHVKLNKVPADGLTKNTGQLYPNEWSKKNDKGIPSDEVVTKHGDIVIKKVNEDSTKPKPLAGAVFEVRLADPNTKSCSDLTRLGPVIKTSTATGADGLVKISDLQLTNWINGKKVNDGDQVPYCLVETTAPKDYQLLPKAIEFKLTKEGTVTNLAGAITADAGNATTIKNYKNPGLPLTGAQGIILVSVLGLILVSIGVVLTVKRRKD